MTEDYTGAANRHFRDGALLQANHRIVNADQLFGFAAECAIKSVLAELPGFIAGGSLALTYHKHVDQLWDFVPLQGVQRRHPGLVAVLKGLQQPFADWSTAQRYGPDAAVNEGILARHRRAAARVLGSVGLSGTRREE